VKEDSASSIENCDGGADAEDIYRAKMINRDTGHNRKKKLSVSEKRIDKKQIMNVEAHRGEATKRRAELCCPAKLVQLRTVWKGRGTARLWKKEEGPCSKRFFKNGWREKGKAAS